MRQKEDYSDDITERNRRVNAKANSLRSRVEDSAGVIEAAKAGHAAGEKVAEGRVLDAAAPADITPVANSPQQLNWGGIATELPLMTPSSAPEMPLGPRPLIPVAPQHGAFGTNPSGMSGVDAIRGFSDKFFGGKR